MIRGMDTNGRTGGCTEAKSQKSTVEKINKDFDEPRYEHLWSYSWSYQKPRVNVLKTGK
jgi:hypothetical protein